MLIAVATSEVQQSWSYYTHNMHVIKYGLATCFDKGTAV